MGDNVEVVILSTADLGSAVWTNKQHLAYRLSASVDVTYIGSIGLRRPNVSTNDVRRIISRLKSIRSIQRKESSHEEILARERIRSITPILLPWHGTRVVDLVNKRIARRYLQENLATYRVLWTFSPIDLGLAKYCDLVIYHSVDLLHELPGTPKRAMLRAEQDILRRADLIIASSIEVCRHLKHLSSSCDPILWENVADTALFEADDVERNHRVIFAGHVTEEKLDISLLESLANRGIPLTIAGPVAVDGTKRQARVDRLLSSPSVSYLGNLSLPDLAAVVRKSKVGIIPYRQNAYTVGVFPMKVYEYLAAGLSVVCSDLPSLRGQDIEGLIVGGEADFVEIVENELKNFDERAARQRSIAARPHSWASRTEEALQLILTSRDRDK